MVPALVEATWVPRETLATGALIDNAPAVSVNVAGVAAPTDAVPGDRKGCKHHKRARNTQELPHRNSSLLEGWPEIPLVALIAVGLRLSTIHCHYTRQYYRDLEILLILSRLGERGSNILVGRSTNSTKG